MGPRIRGRLRSFKTICLYCRETFEGSSERHLLVSRRYAEAFGVKHHVTTNRICPRCEKAIASLESDLWSSSITNTFTKVSTLAQKVCRRPLGEHEVLPDSSAAEIRDRIEKHDCEGDFALVSRAMVRVVHDSFVVAESDPPRVLAAYVLSQVSEPPVPVFLLRYRTFGSDGRPVELVHYPFPSLSSCCMWQEPTEDGIGFAGLRAQGGGGSMKAGIREWFFAFLDFRVPRENASIAGFPAEIDFNAAESAVEVRPEYGESFTFKNLRCLPVKGSTTKVVTLSGHCIDSPSPEG